jgi:hypothetical protein
MTHCLAAHVPIRHLPPEHLCPHGATTTKTLYYNNFCSQSPLPPRASSGTPTVDNRHRQCLWVSYFFQIFNFIGSSVIFLSLSEIPIWTDQRQFGLKRNIRQVLKCYVLIGPETLISSPLLASFQFTQFEVPSSL